MKQSSLKRGFTMIELLVVVVIIGVLAATMFPVIGRMVGRAEDADARNDLRVLGQAAIAYRSMNDNCYPAAGGYFTIFHIYKGSQREERYGRARGWVYFEHDCPREEGDMAASDKIGDGNGDSYGVGGMAQNSEEGDLADDTYVNEAGCCICFDSKQREGGMGADRASWYGKANNGFSKAQVTLINGALFEYVNNSLDVFTNDAFVKAASEKFRIPRKDICRAYAMNVIAGADEELYDTGRKGYQSGGGEWAIRYGQSILRPYKDGSSMGDEVMPQQTALFVELDVEDQELSSPNSLAGDQVWDWDRGDECMGFNHESSGKKYAYVCFADGHVEEIRDPSTDSSSPNQAQRLKLSKYYGSGGQNASGQK